MQQGLLEERDDREVAIYVVWVPMIPSDNEFAARRTGAMFTDPRVTQFYDPHLRLGRAYMNDLFPDCAREALTALRPDDPARDRMEQMAKEPPDHHPLWDAVLFYDQAAEWKDRLPAPLRWSKQFEFWGGDPAKGPTARFWRNDCKNPPVESDWLYQVREAMKDLALKPAS